MDFYVFFHLFIYRKRAAEDAPDQEEVKKKNAIAAGSLSYKDFSSW